MKTILRFNVNFQSFADSTNFLSINFIGTALMLSVLEVLILTLAVFGGVQ